MNPVIYAGLESLPVRILKCSKEYFGIDSFEGRKADVASCKKVSIILLSTLTKLTQEEIAPLVGIKRSNVSYTMNIYAQDYYGGNEYCEFVYLNIKAMIKSKTFYKFNDVAKIALDRLPYTNQEKIDCFGYLNKPVLFKMVRNKPVRAFIVYLKRKSVPSREIAKTLGVPTSGTTLGEIEILNEKRCLRIISEEVKKIIQQHKNQ